MKMIENAEHVATVKVNGMSGSRRRVYRRTNAAAYPFEFFVVKTYVEHGVMYQTAYAVDPDGALFRARVDEDGDQYSHDLH